MSEPTPLGPRQERRRIEHTAETLDRVWGVMRELVALVDDLGDDPLRLHALRSAMREALLLADDASAAASALLARRSLASTFPDGSQAPAVPTPRQVLYLVELAISAPERSRRAAEAAELLARHQQAVAAHDARHGFHQARRCGETTRAGKPCRASALPFLERPACHAHATEDERWANAVAGEAHRSTFPTLPADERRWLQ